MKDRPEAGQHSPTGNSNLQAQPSPKSRGAWRRVNFQIICHQIDQMLITVGEAEDAGTKLFTLVFRVLIVAASFATTLALLFWLAKKAFGGA